MKISKFGLELIKEFEGCDLKATKVHPNEKYLTIGYGHYGSDVKEGSVITKEEAEKMLINDLVKFEKHVDGYNKIYNFNQNEFDALVSFAYNIGNINQLTKNGTRDRETIKKYIVKYNKCGNTVLKGLTIRRKKELELFCKECNTATDNVSKYYSKCKSSNTSIVDGLKEIGVSSDYSNRKKIALANGIVNYKGLGSQNIILLNLLKQGKLVKP